MIVDFRPEPPQPEDRLRRVLKRFLKKLGLEASPQCMWWIKDEKLNERRDVDALAKKVYVTVALAFMETHPYEGQGKDGAFLCERAKDIRDFIEGDLRRVLSDAVMAGEEDRGE